MCISYDDVLFRIKEERLCLDLSQKEMGYYMRMTQSHYGKAELGTRHFTFYELKYLCESDIDIHYVFTGEKAESRYKEMLSGNGYSELVCFLDLYISIVLYYYVDETKDKWKNLFERIQYLRCAIEAYRNKGNIFYNIRTFLDYTQTKMSGILGVDIKKLRNLENGRTLPDSDMLLKLYNLYKIPPALVLEDANSLISEIACLFEMVDEEIVDKMNTFISDISSSNSCRRFVE